MTTAVMISGTFLKAIRENKKKVKKQDKRKRCPKKVSEKKVSGKIKLYIFDPTVTNMYSF
jgi:hypothetical protein